MGIGSTGEPFPQAIVPRPPPVTAVEQLFGVSFALPAKTEQPMQSAVKAESLEIM